MDTDIRAHLSSLNLIESVCISVHPWFKIWVLSSLNYCDRDEIEQ